MIKRNTVGLVAALGLLSLEKMGQVMSRRPRLPGQQTSNRPCETRGKPKQVRVRRKANKLASANRKTNRRK